MSASSIIGGIGGFAVGYQYGYNQANDKIESLEKELSNFKEINRDLQTRFEKLQQQNTQLQKEILNLNKELQSLKKIN